MARTLVSHLQRIGTNRFQAAGRWRFFCSSIYCFRSATRRTNFSPDHTSVTAHTLTSTRPAERPSSRTTFSSTSVATPELFLGQLTHSIPAVASPFARRENSGESSARDLVKNITKSSGLFGTLNTSHADIASPNSVRTSAGALTRHIRNPFLIPNFFGSGVPEYPGIG